MEHIKGKCEVSTDYLYRLLEAEAELTALKENGVENWRHYKESLDKYASYETLQVLGPISTFIPARAIGNFKEYVNWENNEIIKRYLKSVN